MRYTDRSRVLEFQHCPRARYWAYEYDGRGVSRKAINIPLSTGACTHEGLASLATQARETGGPEVDVDQAVGVALQSYERLIEGRGLDVEANEMVEFTYLEQRALIEAMIRGYAKRGLPKLLEEFKVLEVEQEDLMPLVDRLDTAPVWFVDVNRVNMDKLAAEGFPGLGPDSPLVPMQGSDLSGPPVFRGPLELDEEIWWQSRADGLLEELSSGDLYVLSYKTAASWDDRTEASANHDMQGLSEAAAINHRLAALTDGPLAGRKVFGVKMEHLLKGDRRKDSSGMRKQCSPLIRGYRKLDQGVTEDIWTYAWSDTWTCSEPHPMRKSKWYPTGMCEGNGKRHKLPDAYEPFNAWEQPGGVKAWIDMLAAGQVQPEAGDCLSAQLVLPVPYFRDDQQIADWLEQTKEQETKVTLAMQEAQTPPDRGWLNRNFPQHSRACDYPSKCPFQDLCWGAAKDPIGSGIYVQRRPHHEPEARALGER